jgi:hypothetical protein
LHSLHAWSPDPSDIVENELARAFCGRALAIAGMPARRRVLL